MHDSDTAVDLSAFRLMVRRIDHNKFMQQFQHPFIIQQHLASRQTNQSSSEAPSVNRIFSTGTLNVKDLQAIASTAPRVGEEESELVISIKPRGIQAKRLITVGRAKNCDVVFEHTEVSKLHAFFCVPSQMDAYKIMDNGSTNGTSLEGKILPPKQSVALSNGNQIVFGGAVTVIYLTPAGMFEFLGSSRTPPT